AIHDREELPCPPVMGGSVRVGGPLLLACSGGGGGTRYSGGIPGGGPLGGAASVPGDPGAPRGVVSFARAASGTETYSSLATNRRSRVRGSAAAVLDHGSAGG